MIIIMTQPVLSRKDFQEGDRRSPQILSLSRRNVNRTLRDTNFDLKYMRVEIVIAYKLYKLNLAN